MPVYLASDRLTRGVPFGGIGAGKIEILPSGVFNAITFQNNWSDPLTGGGSTVGILGYHLGIWVERRDGKTSSKNAALLQTERVLRIPTVQNIRYEGVFPKATLHYRTQSLGLEVSLEAFSPWIPGDIKNSSLPVVFFELSVKNVLKTPAKVGFILIGRNTSGEWCVGRRNEIRQDQRALHLEFSNEDPTPYDRRQGAVRFSFPKQGWELSFTESWNAVAKNFSFTPQNISLPAWDTFVKNGRLPNEHVDEAAPGENRELCGAVAATRRLRAWQTARFSFTAGWFFPKHIPWGHRYERFFKNVSEVSAYALKRQKALGGKVRRLHELVFSLPFPGWFNDALLATSAPFFASSWHTKDGDFAFYEAPQVCPLMGTLDVGFYGSIPLSYFFPELEFSQISQFAAAQRPDGYIPHDLGKNRLDLPSNGTTFYFWKDLNPKFILMVYRDFLWSGKNKRFLRFYPHMKKALRWTLQADTNGDGLPDHEGADQTFDLWDFRGANAYTSSLFLAALLACERMASVAEDPSFGDQCRGYYLRGRRSFETTLWNGNFFGDTCSLAQLNGQWYADLLGLGLIADRAKIQKALASILKLNGRPSRYGFVNSVLRNGRRDHSNPHAKNLWIGMNWAFISLCISRGLPLNDLLKPARKVWDNISKMQKSPWNQPDMVDAETGRYLFGDFYYRNMAIWAIPIAHALLNKRTAYLMKKIRTLGSRSS